MLKIYNIKWNANDISLTTLTKIKDLIVEKLNQHKISAKILIKDNEILFAENADKKLFISSVDNFVPLKEGDKRIAQYGRNYIVSRRLTKEQVDKMWHGCINETFNKLGIICDIDFQQDDNKVVLRRENIVNEWLKSRSYPQATKG